MVCFLIYFLGRGWCICIVGHHAMISFFGCTHIFYVLIWNLYNKHACICGLWVLVFNLGYDASLLKFGYEQEIVFKDEVN